MTARPVDPESRRRPLRIAVALVLVMAAVLLAGCTAPAFDNPREKAAEGKYVFLEYRANESYIVMSGICHHPSSSACFGSFLSQYTFNEKQGVLNVSWPRTQKTPVNDSLVLFYGRQYSSNQGSCFHYMSGGSFLYSLPASFRSDSPKYTGNMTIESVSKNGTVALRYDDKPIVLNPEERWENVTRETGGKGYSFSDDPLQECKMEITFTQSIYNAGVFEKKTIVLDETR